VKVCVCVIFAIFELFFVALSVTVFIDCSAV